MVCLGANRDHSVIFEISPKYCILDSFADYTGYSTSNLPWLMALTLQVSMQYCSLLIRPCFHHQSHPQLDNVFALFQPLHSFWSYFSSLLQWHTGHLPTGEFIFQCHIFLLFILFMGFSWKEYWSGLPFPSPVDHIFSELSTTTRPSWVPLHGMAHSFTELDKAVVPVISLNIFLWLRFSFCFPIRCIRIGSLWKFPDGRDWLGKTGSYSDGQGHAQ